VTADREGPAAGRRSRTRLVVQGLVSLVLVVAIYYYLLTKIDLAQVWAAITDLTWLELATLGLLATWNLCTYAFVWMTVTPGLGFWRAMVMTQAITAAANTVPGGSAIGIGMTYSMLGSWGYSRSRTTTAVLVSGHGTASSNSPCRCWPWPWCCCRWRRRGPGAGRPDRHRRAGDRHRGVRVDAAQRGPGAPVRAAGWSGRLPTATRAAMT
jgi:hypothetical protein